MLFLLLALILPEGIFLLLAQYLESHNASSWAVGILPVLAGVATISLIFGIAKLIEKIWPIKEEHIGSNF